MVTQRILQHNTKKQATPLGPWQFGRDGLVRLCRTSFELHTPLVLKVAAQHPQDLPSEAEMRRPSPHRKADSPKATAP